MPDENNTQTSNPATNTTSSTSATQSSVVVDPDFSTNDQRKNSTPSDIVSEIIGRINDSRNVLIALSSDPSVDEMATAVGLSLYLDRLGKRATAIYSGTTPNALEFLKPEDTFEPTVDTLQDFVIALNKEKADHLRYKLDGDFVKIYITPYKTRISEEDLEFSYGDFNVDLVLALNVANGIDLDSALREHGRIMHDATIINITNGNPGKLGEIEWSDKSASSISEMIAKLLYEMDKTTPVEKDEATAVLTGIVAATDRFSNAKTTPETMQLSSRLMRSGANQQLISKNITPDVENRLLNVDKEQHSKENSNLDIEHGADVSSSDSKKELEDLEPADSEKLDVFHEPKEGEKIEDLKNDDKNGKNEISQTGSDLKETTREDSGVKEESSELLNDLKMAEESLSHAGAEAVPEPVKPPVEIKDETASDSLRLPELPNKMHSDVNSYQAERVIQPTANLISEFSNDKNTDKYKQMLETALDSVGAHDDSASQETQSSAPTKNPATISAPPVLSAPEINGVPSINYMPMPGEEVLPPPPAPPIDLSPTQVSEPVSGSSTVEPLGALPPVQPITPAAPAADPTLEPLGKQPAMQDQVYTPQAADPGAFKIPGM